MQRNNRGRASCGGGGGRALRDRRAKTTLDCWLPANVYVSSSPPPRAHPPLYFPYLVTSQSLGCRFQTLRRLFPKLRSAPSRAAFGDGESGKGVCFARRVWLLNWRRRHVGDQEDPRAFWSRSVDQSHVGGGSRVWTLLPGRRSRTRAD